MTAAKKEATRLGRISGHMQLLGELKEAIEDYRQGIEEADTLARWNGVPEAIQETAMGRMEASKSELFDILQTILDRDSR